MAKQVPWNRPLYEEFLRLTFLTELQRSVMDMHVCRHSTNYQIAMELNVSEATVDRTIHELKKIYDSVQPYSSILPKRRKLKES